MISFHMTAFMFQVGVANRFCCLFWNRSVNCSRAHQCHLARSGTQSSCLCWMISVEYLKAEQRNYIPYTRMRLKATAPWKARSCRAHLQRLRIAPSIAASSWRPSSFQRKNAQAMAWTVTLFIYIHVVLVVPSTFISSFHISILTHTCIRSSMGLL